MTHKMNPTLRITAALCFVALSAFAQPKPLSSYDAQAKALLAKMTLEEKIGQMTQADHAAVADLAEVERYFLGSVLSGGRPASRRDVRR